MKCILLAAGYATRLYPLTKNFPKPLLEVGEKTILDWLIDDIYATGKIKEFAVVTNHKFAGIFEDWTVSCQKTIMKLRSSSFRGGAILLSSKTPTTICSQEWCVAVAADICCSLPVLIQDTSIANMLPT